MPRSSGTSAQRYPLTTIFGTEANVRVLRELSRHGGQLSAPALATRTGLSKGSVRAALMSLDGLGAVSAAGTERSRLYNIRAGYPLRGAIDTLFESEEGRFGAILESVREAARGCGSDVVAIWLYGSVARGEDRPESDLDIAVVTAENDVTKIADAMVDALRSSGEKLGYTPSVVSITTKNVARLDRETDPWWTEIGRDALVLLGPRPDELARQLRSTGKKRAAA